MTADRVLHLLGAPAASPAAAHRRGPPRPQRIGFPPVKRRVAVAFSSSTEEDGMTYKGAGVDIDAGAELVRRIRKMAPWIGGFGGILPRSIIHFISYAAFFVQKKEKNVRCSSCRN